MSKKPKILAAMFFMYVSLICVGFASWTISGGNTEPVSISTNGSIQTDDVINTDDYLQLSSGPEIFKYGERCFVNNSKEYVQDGYVKIGYSIDLGNCKKIFTDINSLTISLVLEHDSSLNFSQDNGLFDSFSLTDNQSKLTYTQTFEVLINENKLTGTQEITDSKCSIKFKLSNYFNLNNVETAEILISYHWKINDPIDYFKNTIYPIIYDTKNNVNKLSFIFSASIVGN